MVNTAVVLAAALAINGVIAPPQGHYCLRFVRQVVEHAYGWAPMEFYRQFWTHTVEENRSGEPWARDLERSLRNAGFQVHEPAAGDLVFNYRSAWPKGHAGVMLSDVLVLDVWPSVRGSSLRVTPVWVWAPTTVIRLPDPRAGP